MHPTLPFLAQEPVQHALECRFHGFRAIVGEDLVQPGDLNGIRGGKENRLDCRLELARCRHREIASSSSSVGTRVVRYSRTSPCSV